MPQNIRSLVYIHYHVYDFFAEHELREQRQLLEAVRGILTPAVRSALSPEQQAFLNAEASWQPPAPATGLYLSLCCCCMVLKSRMAQAAALTTLISYSHAVGHACAIMHCCLAAQYICAGIQDTQ